MWKVFGAFLDCNLKIDDSLQSYRGSPESFVFRFEFGKKEYSIFEYHHTGSEHTYLFDSSGITIGKAESPALFIQSNLLNGTSVECSTFRNEPLSAGKQVFEIKDLEIWCPTLENSIISGGFTYYEDLGYLGTVGSPAGSTFVGSKKWESTL